MKFKERGYRIASIQILRGISAWLVVFHHYNQMYFSWNMSKSIYGETVGRFIQYYGKLGIDIFFVISGFVIFLTASKHTSASAFIRNRIVRIVPPYWFFTFILLIISILIPKSVSSDWNVTSLIKSLLFIYHENPSPVLATYPFLPVGWTLNLEIVFYLFCGFSIFFFKKRWFLPVFFLIFFHELWPFNFLKYFFLTPYIKEFSFGLLIGFFYLNDFIPNDNRLASVFLLISIISFYIGGADRYKYYAITFLMISAISFNDKHFDCNVINVLKYLGEISYSTYLVHPIIIYILLYFFGTFPSPVNELALSALYVFLILATSSLSYKYIEYGKLSNYLEKNLEKLEEKMQMARK